MLIWFLMFEKRGVTSFLIFFNFTLVNSRRKDVTGIRMTETSLKFFDFNTSSLQEDARYQRKRKSLMNMYLRFHDVLHLSGGHWCCGYDHDSSGIWLGTNRQEVPARFRLVIQSTDMGREWSLSSSNIGCNTMGFAAALAVLFTEASQSRQHGMSDPARRGLTD
ncbi:hypothetical protein Tco_0771338 [Tanacetum coccineum]|uniref:Uncharacterized protein n=1 Tax=Tanacetum coccineum TaxID=301880 RepID=A0ABQ4ZHM8_9ASTR